MRNSVGACDRSVEIPGRSVRLNSPVTFEYKTLENTCRGGVHHHYAVLSYT